MRLILNRDTDNDRTNAEKIARSGIVQSERSMRTPFLPETPFKISQRGESGTARGADSRSDR